MSNTRHRIWIGSPTLVDIDGAYSPPQTIPFTADSTLIFASSTERTADETT